MNTTSNQAREIFLQAIELQSAEDRAQYLTEACRGDEELLSRVQRLLESHEVLGSFHDQTDASSITKDFGIPEQLGDTIGPYKLLQQIGEGGMGVVYLAEQTEPVERRVALKVIKPGMDSRQVIARFEAERQALAVMDHPNIAKVLDAGTTDTGRPYFVMEMVKGVPVTQYCDDKQLTPRARLELFVPICQAVQHAHLKGIIHRDIKPSNVLVAEYDERAVTKVIDFGVAKAIEQRLTEKTVFTEFGQVVGTPEYMSPEQAKLNQLDIDTRTDVYSLGVLLYELLTGETPFDRQRLRSAAFDELLRIIREEEPPRPSLKLSSSQSLPSIAANRHVEPKQLSATVHGELDWIVMKALEKDRTRRYDTASKFAEDVQHYLNDEAVAACPPSAVYRFRKFAHRNKPFIATTAAIVAALLIGTGVATWQAMRARQAERVARANEQVAKEQESQAEQSERTTRRNLYTSNMNLADVAWERGNVGHMLELLEAERPRDEEADLRGFEWYYLWELCHRGLINTLHGHKDTVRSLAFSPEDTTLASGSADGMIKVWNLSRGSEKTYSSIGASAVRSLAFSPNGETLCAGREDGAIELWDTSTFGLRLTLHGHSEPVEMLAFSSDGQSLFTGDRAQIKQWNLSTNREETSIETLKKTTSVAVSPDGNIIAAGGFQEVNLQDLKTGQWRTTEGFHRWFIRAIAFSPDGKLLASGARDESTVRVFDVATGKPIATLVGHRKGVLSVAFSPDGKLLASGSADGTAKLWDLATEKYQSYGHLDSVYCVAFSPDGRTLATAGGDRVVRLWDLEVPRTRPRLPVQKNRVWAARFSPDNRQLATASFLDTVVNLWDSKTGQKLRTFTGHGSAGPCSVAFSPDGRFLAAGGHDDTVRVWDAATGEPQAILEGPGNDVHAVEFSPDGTLLAASGTGQHIKIWDTRTWKKVAVYRHPEGWCWSLAFSADSTRLAAEGEGAVKVWDLSTGRETTFPSNCVNDSFVSFSPNGDCLAAISNEVPGSFYKGLKVEFWDLATARELKSISVSSISVIAKSIAFPPDWKYLAIGGSDGSVKLLDVATGQERATLAGHQDQITTISFSPDGRMLGTGGWDGTAEIWPTASEDDVMIQSSNRDLEVQ